MGLTVGLQKGNLAVELDSARIEMAPVDADLGQHVRREISLVGQVVDGEHRGRSRMLRLRQQERKQARVPVIGMDDIRLPIRNAAGEPGGDMRQEGEATRVVGPVPAVTVLIQAAIAHIERRRVDQPYRDQGIRKLAGDQRGILHAQKRLQPRLDAWVLQPGKRAGISRHQNADIHALLHQRDRQRARHIGQPAGFRQRISLRGYEQYTHRSTLRLSTNRIFRPATPANIDGGQHHREPWLSILKDNAREFFFACAGV
ncbi:MAG: hypothetical protein WDN03_08855 [Rhizomicrobium sp.]